MFVLYERCMLHSHSLPVGHAFTAIASPLRVGVGNVVPKSVVLWNRGDLLQTDNYIYRVDFSQTIILTEYRVLI